MLIGIVMGMPMILLPTQNLLVTLLRRTSPLRWALNRRSREHEKNRPEKRRKLFLRRTYGKNNIQRHSHRVCTVEALPS
jgi:hypothetical protein